MKTCHFLVLLLLGASCVLAEENPNPYQDEVLRLRDKLNRLLMQKYDTRPGAKTLSAAEEDSRLRLTTQLAELDPISELMEQLSEDIRVLHTSKPSSPGDAELLDERKDFLAFLAGITPAVKSLAEAQEIAATARGYVLRRDLAGFKTFAQSKN